MADPAAQITRVYDPSVRSSSHTYMASRLRVLRAVYAGTEGLRAGAKEFLPQYAKESDDKYRVRSKEARLRRNMFRQSVDRITGRIFEVPTQLKPPSGAKELSAAAKVFADDADRRGKSFDRCARVLYKEALKLGMMHCLVDYPVVTAANLAEERAAGARPYMVMLNPEQVIRCYVHKDTGHVVHLAWTEEETVWDEAFNQEVTVHRVHERYPGRAITWVDRPARPPAQTPGQSSSIPRTGWQKESEGTVVIPGADAGRIMFHTLYAEKEEHMVGRTPLTEVADITIEHYQIASEYRNALKHNLFPILTMTGVDTTKAEGQVVMGPETILGSSNHQAKFAMLEHNGTAIKAGKDDLDSLEQKAEAYAGQLTKPSGDVKATTAAINSAEVSSFAKDMAQELEDVLQAIVDDASLWAGEPKLGDVEVNMDFAIDLPDGDLQVLQSARSAGDISRPTLWRELTRRNVLSRDFDPAEEERLLEEQEAEAMEREQEAMKFASSLEAPRVPAAE